ncbi:MAG: CapA family protein [Polyangiaceae bacterium]
MHEGLSGELAGAVGVANLEGPVGEAPPCDEGKVCLANARERLAAARRAGLSVLGIANNHALDRGPDGPDRTAAVLRELGFGPCGGPAGPAYVVRGGRGVAVTAHDLGAGLPARLADELMVARRRADDLVATFHVTGPPSYLPRATLRDAVRVALDAGARVVASHGSHALVPIERRGEAVVAWGLGNLRFACDCTRERDALLLRLELDEGPVKARVIPIDAGLGGAPARPASDPGLTLDLLEALGSTSLRRDGATAWLV